MSTVSGARWQAILRWINDGNHHRREAAAMRAGQGRSLIELDFEEHLARRELSPLA